MERDDLGDGNGAAEQQSGGDRPGATEDEEGIERRRRKGGQRGEGGEIESKHWGHEIEAELIGILSPLPHCSMNWREKYI